jgi:dihydroorotate dehydrogenase
MSLILSSGKQEIIINRPIINSAGMLGFSDELRSTINLDALGAFITNPVSFTPRMPARVPRTLYYRDRVLLHTGLPNPGLDRVLDAHASRWARFPIPVILHLLVESRNEALAMLDRIEREHMIQAVEIGLLGEDHQHDCHLLEAVCSGMLPVLARLPAISPISHVLELERIGAAAVVLGPPRGTIFHGGSWVSGRLYGPGLLPQTSYAVIRVAGKLSCPLIAGSGIFSRSDAEALLKIGVSAVELDTLLWTDPDPLLDPPLTFSSESDR